MSTTNGQHIERTIRSLEVDRLLKLMDLHARKHHDGHYTVFSFADGYKAAFGTPDLDHGDGRLQLDGIKPHPRMKDALVDALLKEKSFNDYVDMTHHDKPLFCDRDVSLVPYTMFDLEMNQEHKVVDLRPHSLATDPSAPYCLWKIIGEAHNDSSGGEETVYAATESETHLPDPHLAIRISTEGRYRFYMLRSIEVVDDLYGGIDE